MCSFYLKICTVSACCVPGEREFQSRIVAGRNDAAYCCVLTLSKGILSAFFLEDNGLGIDLESYV